MSVTVGPVLVQCPTCPDIVEVPVVADLDEDLSGTQRITLEPDMTDLWAHAWTHEAPAEG